MDRPLRVNVTLDPEHDAKLTQLAERTHLEKGTLARSLLLQAIDEADTEPRNVVTLLDGIPGARERADGEPRQRAPRRDHRARPALSRD